MHLWDLTNAYSDYRVFYVSQSSTGTGTVHMNFGGADPGGYFGTIKDENGKGNFKYNPPSGYMALCTSNILRAVGTITD